MEYGNIIYEINYNNKTVKAGDEVYILLKPSNSKNHPEYGFYRYKKAKLMYIYPYRLYYKTERPSGYSYKYIQRMWDYFYDQLDESFACDYKVKYDSSNGCDWTTVKRKYIYFSWEYDRLCEDIKNLNDILDFKQKQKEKFNEFVRNKIIKDKWNYNNFESLKREK